MPPWRHCSVHCFFAPVRKPWCAKVKEPLDKCNLRPDKLADRLWPTVIERAIRKECSTIILKLRQQRACNAPLAGATPKNFRDNCRTAYAVQNGVDDGEGNEYVARDRASAMTGAIANLTCGSLVD